MIENQCPLPEGFFIKSSVRGRLGRLESVRHEIQISEIELGGAAK